MSPAECKVCEGIETLRDAEIYQSEAGDWWKIEELPTAIAVLSTDQYYPGYTLVVAKTHAMELYHLAASESTQDYQDMLRVATALATAFKPRKMNDELLGNTEARLH